MGTYILKKFQIGTIILTPSKVDVTELGARALATNFHLVFFRKV